MSPHIGEPGHETRGWTHAICDQDWFIKNPNRQPIRVTDLENQDTCCYCGQPTNGIYVRDDPKQVHP